MRFCFSPVWRGGVPQLARALSSAVIVTTRNKSATASPAPVKYKPYSPFQNTSNAAEYAVARLDDLLNWGRKVMHLDDIAYTFVSSLFYSIW